MLITIIANVGAALVAAYLLYMVLFFWIGRPILRHYRKFVMKSQDYDKEIDDINAIEKFRQCRLYPADVPAVYVVGAQGSGKTQIADILRVSLSVSEKPEIMVYEVQK